MRAVTKEHVERVTDMSYRVYEIFLERSEIQDIFVATMLNLLATQIKDTYPNDISKQDSKIEEYADIIKLTLIHNGVRQSS
jgi:hypothetical protein